jgi:hypothetical protein
VVKDVYEAFHQSFPVLTLEKLKIAAVTVRKRNAQAVAFIPGEFFI